MKLSFTKKTCIIVCHDAMYGPPHALRDYLLEHNIHHLLFIGHSNKALKDNPIKASYCEIYKEGKLIKKIQSKKSLFNEPLVYIFDVYLTLYWSLRYGSKPTHYYIGLSNLNAFIGILLSWFNLVKIPVYYVIDYIPHRFSNFFINNLYHILDAFCALFAYQTWNYGKGMIKAREEKWKRVFLKQIHTPHGISLNKDVIKNSYKYKPYSLVYLGTLFEQQGLQIVIEALPLIKKRYSEVSLTIIGFGPYYDHLQDMCSKLDIQTNVTFIGYLPDNNQVDELVSKHALGIATYKNDIGFVMYTEPGKVKRYLSCGIPIIITKDTPLENEINAFQCGISTIYDKESVAINIINFFSDKKMQKTFRNNAIDYASHFTWEEIFTRIFNKLVRI